MTSPPTSIVPLPVVIAEGRISVAAERVTTPVISNSHIASTIIGRVACPVHREGSIPIDRYVIATAKFIRVAKAIKLGIPCSVDRDVSLTINRYAVPSTQLVGVAITIHVRVPFPIHRDVSFTIRLEISCPVHCDVPIAIHRKISLASCSWRR
jgi:hypothetical protein